MKSCKDGKLKIRILHACLFELDSSMFQVSRICKYLRISREAFYYHFSDKKSLLDSCASYLLKDFFSSRADFILFLSEHLDYLLLHISDMDVLDFFQAMKRILNEMKTDFGTFFIGYILVSLTDRENRFSRDLVENRIDEIYEKTYFLLFREKPTDFSVGQSNASSI